MQSGEHRVSAHPFDDAIALTSQGEDLWHGHTSAPYANMVGPFGGITAAQALNAVLGHPKRQGEPVAFTVNFAAALADGAFDVQVRPVRTVTAAAPSCGCATIRRARSTSLRSRHWPTCSSRASGAAVRP